MERQTEDYVNLEKSKENEYNELGIPYLKKVRFHDKVYRGFLIGSTWAFVTLCGVEQFKSIKSSFYEGAKSCETGLVRKLEELQDGSHPKYFNFSETGREVMTKKIEDELETVRNNADFLYTGQKPSKHTLKACLYLGVSAILYSLYAFRPRTKEEEWEEELEFKTQVLKAKLGIK
jgi:hypothetical protein